MRQRQGFTITELLVAFALIMFIMVILTEAFTAGLESFRILKAIGDMQERMRSVSIILRRDLQKEHFENKDNRGNRLSDIDLRIGRGSPPDEGFFRIWQRNNPADANPMSLTWNSTRDFGVSSLEGQDLDGIPTTVSTEHVLHFTIKLPLGSLPANYMFVQLPGYSAADETNLATQGGQVSVDIQKASTMPSHWAEVVYFLVPKIGRTAKGTQLYSLYRRQRLLAHPGVSASLTPSNEYNSISLSNNAGATAGTMQVNTPASITEPRNRFGSSGGMEGAYPGASNNPPFQGWSLEDTLGFNYAQTQYGQAGDDLLLTDVVAFDVKVIQQGYPTANGIPVFADLPPASAGSNPTFKAGVPFSVFDSWSKNKLPPGSTAGSPYYGETNPSTGRSYWDGRPIDTDAATNTLQAPSRIRIIAIQVTVRVWDEKTEQSRQVSIIQEM